ncbi:hypothetical protein HU750_14260 [Pseudomonas sp. SWRI50]|uniref:alcohol dehydrogenase catalytic domain-containing protein n=1 Tax=Pseudomonas sp. SWRI50 TaxID=2745484 RepID=UPI0016443EEC|nr:hypothetical protein [Pseudomonas sp. SWRI50]MBC3486839.1 hypothetical protein [Pseudomonas sp. SWRI50]
MRWRLGKAYQREWLISGSGAGWDTVGIVREVGSDVSLFNVGDEVFYAGAIDQAP